MDRPRGWLQDVSGSVADLGVLAPIAAALILGNGLDAGTVLVGVGTLYLVAGLYFRVPVPVQPIKAAAAIAIARDLPAETIGAAGVVLGAALVLLGTTGAAKYLAKAFAPPVVRGLQLAVGLILVRTAIDLASQRSGTVPMIVVIAVAVALVVGSRGPRRFPLALTIVCGAVMYTLVTSDTGPILDAGLWHPTINQGMFDLEVLGSALVLLVIPQIPLTFGNAVVAITDLEHRYFPNESHKVNARSISLSCGVANMAAGAMTGMPMCHGSGGLTAHYRAGARTFRMNLAIGGTLLAVGLFLGPTALSLLTLIPIEVLAGFLAFTGLFHSSLAASLRGTDIAIAVIIGVLGLLTTNLAIALGVGLALYWPQILLSRRRALGTAPS